MEVTINKTWYRRFIIVIKYMPYVLALAYMLNSLFGFYKIENRQFGYLAYLSVLPFVSLWLTSVVLRFCTYHRLPLYYIIINNSIAVIDYYIGIPIKIMDLFLLHLFIVGVFLLLYIYLKVNKINILNLT